MPNPIPRFRLEPGGRIVELEPHELWGKGNMLSQVLPGAYVAICETQVPVPPDGKIVLPDGRKVWVVGSGSGLLKKQRVVLGDVRVKRFFRTMFSTAADASAYAARLVTASHSKVMRQPQNVVKIVSKEVLPLEDMVFLRRGVARVFARYSQVTGVIGRRVIKGTAWTAPPSVEKLMKDLKCQVLITEGAHKGDGRTDGDLVLGVINTVEALADTWMAGSIGVTLLSIHTPARWAQKGYLPKKEEEIVRESFSTLGQHALPGFSDLVDVLTDEDQLKDLVMGKLWMDTDEDAELKERMTDAIRMLDAGFKPSVVGAYHPRQEVLQLTWARRLRAFVASFGLIYKSAKQFHCLEADEHAREVGKDIVLTSDERLPIGGLTTMIRHPVRSAHGLVEVLVVRAKDVLGYDLPPGAVIVSKGVMERSDGDADGDDIGILTGSPEVRMAHVNLVRIAQKYEWEPPPSGKEPNKSMIWVGDKDSTPIKELPRFLNWKMSQPDGQGLFTRSLHVKVLARAECKPRDPVAYQHLREQQAHLQVSVQTLKKVIQGDVEEATRQAARMLRYLPLWLRRKRQYAITPQSRAFVDGPVLLEKNVGRPFQRFLRKVNEIWMEKNHNFCIQPIGPFWLKALETIINEEIPWNDPRMVMPGVFKQAQTAWRQLYRECMLKGLSADQRKQAYADLSRSLQQRLRVHWETLDRPQQLGLVLKVWKEVNSKQADNSGGFLKASGALDVLLGHLRPAPRLHRGTKSRSNRPLDTLTRASRSTWV